MNLMSKQNPEKPNVTPPISDTASGLDLNFLIHEKEHITLPPPEISSNGDDCMVDISDDSADTKMCLSEPTSALPLHLKNGPSKEELQSQKKEKDEDRLCKIDKIDIKPMTDLSVTLESIKPSSLPPLTVLEDKNGITIVFHFAKDKPREDVQVMVVTTISKNSSSLSNFHFQAVVPKVRIYNYFFVHYLQYIIFIIFIGHSLLWYTWEHSLN